MILVVDDSPLIRSFVVAVLGRLKWQACEATNASAAEALCAVREFDLILLDLELPDASGITAYQRIRRLKLHHDTPIVFMSGHAAEKVVPTLIDLHAVYYLAKPFTITQLEMLLQELTLQHKMPQPHRA